MMRPLVLLVLLGLCACGEARPMSPGTRELLMNPVPQPLYWPQPVYRAW